MFRLKSSLISLLLALALLGTGLSPAWADGALASRADFTYPSLSSGASGSAPLTGPDENHPDNREHPDHLSRLASIEEAAGRTATYLNKRVSRPQATSVGGAWTVLGLARLGADLGPGPSPAYYQTYVDALSGRLEEGDGVLHERKYTDYSLHALALTALGKDPRRVAGYDLLAPLSDYHKTVWQGINGAIWALIALDAGRAPEDLVPEEAALRKSYLDHILGKELAGGGFSLSGKSPADADITAMALTALAGDQKDPRVLAVVDRGLGTLADLQKDDGSFTSFGHSNAESLIQTLVALTELGLSPDHPAFVKEGRSLVDLLLDYQGEDGGFKHTLSAREADLMTSEQALYGLVAARRQLRGERPLFDMLDAPTDLTQKTDKRKEDKEEGKEEEGKADRHPDLKVQPVRFPHKTFKDLKGHRDQGAVLALAQRGILKGVEEDLFLADRTMTRAEFSTLLVRALGLAPRTLSVFKDVSEEAWYAPMVGAAYHYGLVKGTGPDAFSPKETIRRDQAVTMVVRAGRLAGLGPDLNEDQVRDLLAPFSDYTQVASYARLPLAYAYQQGILDDQALAIYPEEAVDRGQVAQMVYRLLDLAGLLD